MHLGSLAGLGADLDNRPTVMSGGLRMELGGRARERRGNDWGRLSLDNRKVSVD